MAEEEIVAIAVVAENCDDVVDADDSDDGSTLNLTSIWDDDMIEKNGTSSWKCLWCEKLFQGRHASKAIAHLAKVKGLSIAVRVAGAIVCTHQIFLTINFSRLRSVCMRTLM